jgi:tRNA A-37 threonylcarbamoyl transferase component Bud32
MSDETQKPIPPVPPAPTGELVPPPGADTVASLPQPRETITPDSEEAAKARDRVSPASPRAVHVPGYEILGELGRGGMGVVYKARQLKLNRVVALKMVLSAQHADSRELIRFLSEAESVAAIKHPHVVQVYDSGEADGRPYMAMECLEGGSLVTRLRERGRLDPSAAAGLVLKIARGVQAAHARGIVHRDLKPHNVLLDTPPPTSPPGAWGEPKVTDFGLAKRGGSDLTQTGAIMGTPAYMAPEQAMGVNKLIGPPADVYALGVILYECLAGSVPFTGEDPWAVLRRVVNDEPEPVNRRAAGIPRDLNLICRKCLEKKPADRYADAGELADDLQRFLDGEALRGPRTDVWYTLRRAARKWRRPAAALAAVALVAVAAVVAWVVFAPKSEDPLVQLRREEVLRRVEVLHQTPPNPDRQWTRPPAQVPELPQASYAGFKVLNDERVVDMREWRPNTTNDPGIDSFVVYHQKRDLVKITATNELRAETRTSGGDAIMRAMRPSGAKVTAFASEKPGFVGKQAMKVRHLVYDVSDIPLNTEFTLQYATTYVNSLQSEDEQWFGVIGYEGSFKTSMLMLFPPDRPFKDYVLKVAPTREDDPTKRKDPEKYTGPVITFAAKDKSWVYWEIPSPKANYVYRVDWTW